jgi:hypothetical protein
MDITEVTSSARLQNELRRALDAILLTSIIADAKQYPGMRRNNAARAKFLIAFRMYRFNWESKIILFFTVN